ncbi:glutathione S-transferase [Rhizobium sp. CFBP 8762]|uniref:glutathione S-transferase n=1 Tax=Rhizobium sp. CFBP 8762 TaxID=2775279 RepID=UPI00178629A4|nr:glutathione S-transferase [Rhizobium sp. CFBP 8762]MBD8553038.1 glutathione S-transferase [Rhizobium sp. CFBP 8762]
MKLYYSPASPYSAKVRMAAHFAGLKLEAVLSDTATDPADLIANNPLGKIPTLETDDGRSIFDSRSIMHFIDRETGGTLYPQDARHCTDVEVLEALCDGICDSLLAIVYEKRTRPEDKQHQPAMDRQWQKVVRALDHLEAHVPQTGPNLHAGHFALAAALRYLDLRFEGQWQDGRQRLVDWRETFAQAFPDVALFRS